MECPDNELISRYADGEVDDTEKREAERHIRECESCRKEYESFAAMGELMTRHWDGKIEGCFDAETLAEFLAGQVDDDVQEQIREHVAHCEVCAAELELLRQMDVEGEADIPVERDKGILASILAHGREEEPPSFASIKGDFRQAAKKLTERFIARFHGWESSMVESFWNMFSPSYSRETKLGDISLDAGVSAVAGDARDIHTPEIIFAMLGTCDYIQELDKLPDRKELSHIIKLNTRRFGISRDERRKLQEFLLEQLYTES
jgi:hypothetical protein